MLHVCRNLRSSRFYVLIELFLHGPSFEHFSPTFNYMGMDDYWKHLVRTSGTRTSLFFIVIPRITSRRTTLNLNSHSFACKGFSSHWNTLWTYFQSSVCVCVPEWGRQMIRIAENKSKDGQVDSKQKVRLD